MNVFDKKEKHKAVVPTTPSKQNKNVCGILLKW
jgi:hypothetical protein